MDDQPIDIARFASVNEAAVARNALEAAGIPAFLDGAATATWLWHFGTAIGGVRLFVRPGDVEQARAILSGDDVEDASESRPEDACSPNDDWGEPEVEDEAASGTLPITRAWRAAIIGILFFPPLLSLYSMWLLIRHRLLFSGRTRPTDWRAVAAFAVNVVVLALVALFVSLAVVSSDSHAPPTRPGGDRTLKQNITVTVPLIPVESASEAHGVRPSRPNPPPAGSHNP
jgi:hypothetical protein